METRFPGQKPDEIVKVLVRPHWLILLRTVAAILFLAIVPLAVLAVLVANQTDPFSGIGLAVTAVTVPAYYLTLITWFFIAWVDYYLDVGIVTDQRIIDIDQLGLFRRNIAELDCRMVQDIDSDKSGVLETIFDFGTVTVQTAGERPNFTFHAVPHPDRMVERIRDAVSSRHDQEDGAAEAVNEAAVKMEEAAEHLEQPTAPAPAPAQPATPNQPPQPEPEHRNDTPQDLPREYEQ